jgi:predicted amidohydrolase YtcJ
MMLDAESAGLQLAVHAIGERAVDEVIDIHQQIANRRASGGAAGAQPQQRHRIEHAQHLSGGEAAGRIARLGLSVVANPLHLLSDRHMLLRRLGEQRAAPGRAFAYRWAAAWLATPYPARPGAAAGSCTAAASLQAVS